MKKIYHKLRKFKIRADFTLSEDVFDYIWDNVLTWKNKSNDHLTSSNKIV